MPNKNPHLSIVWAKNQNFDGRWGLGLMPKKPNAIPSDRGSSKPQWQ